jgi:hypothetical protein
VIKHILYFLFLIPGIILFQFLSAQEPVKRPYHPEDSLKLSAPGLYEPGFNLSALKPDLFNVTDINLTFVTPSIDFSGILNKRWKIDGPFTNRFLTFPSISTYFFFPGTGTVFNQAVYQATDKLKIGGNSFGINSLLHAPLPGVGLRNYDYRGMSVFMEYKINKNFRIGGSISVAGNPYQP